MDYKKAVGLGILFWVIMFGAVSIILPWYDKFVWAKVLIAVFAGILTFTLSQYLKIENYSDALLFGMIIVVVSIGLDIAIVTRFNAEIFTYWQLWLGYALALFAPSIRFFRFKGR